VWHHPTLGYGIPQNILPGVGHTMVAGSQKFETSNLI
jgi:hypothetical protein